MTSEAHDVRDEAQAPEREWARRCSGHLRTEISGSNAEDRATNHQLLYQNVGANERKGLWMATRLVLGPGAFQKVIY
jgi:hypothetical protein